MRIDPAKCEYDAELRVVFSPPGISYKSRAQDFEGSLKFIDPVHGDCLIESEDYFVWWAVAHYRWYNDPSLLLWAIDKELPSLLQDEDAKELFRRLITGKLRKRGESPKRQLKANAYANEIFERIWFHHVQNGMPVYNNPDSGAKGPTACTLAAKEIGKSAPNAYKVWTKREGAKKVRLFKKAAKRFGWVTIKKKAAKRSRRVAIK